MTDETPLAEAMHGDPDWERCHTLLSAMLSAAAADQRSDDMDPHHHTSLTMAAAGRLAGYLAGALIGAGIARDQDKRRMGEMLLANFRNGIVLGKEQALVSATQGATRQ